MKKILKHATETRTGIRIEQDGDRVETFNILGERIHVIDRLRPDDGIFIVRWSGVHLDEEVKEIVAGHYFEGFCASGCTRLFVDASQSRASWTGVNDWQREEILPRLIAAGLQRCALLLPGPDAMLDPDVAEAHETAGEQLAEGFEVIAVFSSEQKALAWLRSAP
jgi:hypothetical protein